VKGPPGTTRLSKSPDTMPSLTSTGCQLIPDWK
jgi:hypothetical protein